MANQLGESVCGLAEKRMEKVDTQAKWCDHESIPLKSSLCNYFEATGYCFLGAICRYAHGMEDLHSESGHTNYSRICRRYKANGCCCYGTRCWFEHVENNLSAQAQPPPEYRSGKATGIKGMYPAKGWQPHRSLELRNVPRRLNNIPNLHQHFVKFGKIIYIKISHDGDPEGAVIKFSEQAEAYLAYRSSNAVLNNPFIKVFWHKEKQPLAGEAITKLKVPQRIRYTGPHARSQSAVPILTFGSTKFCDDTALGHTSGVVEEAVWAITPVPSVTSLRSYRSVSVSSDLKLKNNVTRYKKKIKEAKPIVQPAHKKLRSAAKNMKTAAEPVERCKRNGPQRVKTLGTAKNSQGFRVKMRKNLSAAHGATEETNAMELAVTHVPPSIYSHLENRPRTRCSMTSGMIPKNNGSVDKQQQKETVAAAQLEHGLWKRNDSPYTESLGMDKVLKDSMDKLQKKETEAGIELEHGLCKSKDKHKGELVKQINRADDLVERCKPKDSQCTKTLGTGKVLEGSIDKQQQKGALAAAQLEHGLWKPNDSQCTKTLGTGKVLEGSIDKLPEKMAAEPEHTAVQAPQQQQPVVAQNKSKKPKKNKKKKRVVTQPPKEKKCPTAEAQRISHNPFEILNQTSKRRPYKLKKEKKQEDIKNGNKAGIHKKTQNQKKKQKCGAVAGNNMRSNKKFKK